VYVAVLGELSSRIAPPPSGEEDPFERVARELEIMTPTSPEQLRG
jgi:hypothetical protein